MSEQLPDHIYSVLISLHEESLVLPNSAVVEVAGREAWEPREGEPDWWLGQYRGPQGSVPLVSIEAMLGRGVPPVARKSRLVVLRSLTGVLPHGQFAILSQSYPLLVTLTEPAVSAAAPLPTDSEELVVTRAQVANRQALIPNLEAIEAMIAELT